MSGQISADILRLERQQSNADKTPPPFPYARTHTHPNQPPSHSTFMTRVCLCLWKVVFEGDFFYVGQPFGHETFRRWAGVTCVC